MVRLSIVMLKDGISKTLSLSFSDMLVCPLSKQPLRFCEESNSLISDAIGVSFPCTKLPDCKVWEGYMMCTVLSLFPGRLEKVNGIPCLVPKDGKIIDTEDMQEAKNDVGTPHQESTSRG